MIYKDKEMNAIEWFEKIDYDDFKDSDSKHSEYKIIEGYIYCYGIRIQSRYEKINELLQMISFCKLAFENRICEYIDTIFYDSKSCICSFTLKVNGKLFGCDNDDLLRTNKDYYNVCLAVSDIANKTIGTHFLMGYCDGLNYQGLEEE
jgi:hypothetical protein